MPSSAPNRTLLAVAIALGCAGCSPAPFPDLQPLTGKISYDGKPLKGGGLLFQAPAGKSGGYIVNANINPDGTFAAETSRVTDAETIFAAGAPQGTYTVVFHPSGDDGSEGSARAELPDLVVVGLNGAAAVLEIPKAKPIEIPKPKAESPKAEPPAKSEPPRPTAK